MPLGRDTVQDLLDGPSHRFCQAEWQDRYRGLAAALRVEQKAHAATQAHADDLGEECERLLASGMVRVGHSWTILRAVGLYESKGNKKKFGQNPQLGGWAPAWSVLLCNWFRNKWRKRFVVTGRQMLAIALRVAKHDAHLQGAITSAYAVGGEDALVALLKQELLDA